MQKRRLISIVAVIGLSSLLLIGCSNAKQEDPNVVIQKFKQAVSNVTSGEVFLAMQMKGSDATNSIDADMNVDVSFDKSDLSDKKIDLRADVGGTFDVDARAINGNVGLTLRTIGKDVFVKLDKLDVDDPQVAALQPLVTPYINQWLKLADEFIPENIRNLQEGNDELTAQQEELRKIFIESSILKADKVFGIEKVDGKNTLRLAISFDADGMRDYLKRSAAITRPDLTEAQLTNLNADLDQAVAVFNSILNAEIWIGVDDYLPYKAVISLSGNQLNQAADMDVELNITGKNYNKNITIKAPEDAQEFNPISLLLGAGNTQLPSEAMASEAEDGSDIAQ